MVDAGELSYLLDLKRLQTEFSSQIDSEEDRVTLTVEDDPFRVNLELVISIKEHFYSISSIRKFNPANPVALIENRGIEVF